jgi:SAM-dependent methyltransferase/Zn ribbon nucleic-acid-binding protein
MSLNHQKKYNEKIHEWILKVKEKAHTISKSNRLQKVNCPVCKNKDSEPFVNNDSLDYVKCPSCNLVYMNPPPNPEAVNQGFLGQDPLLKEYFDIVIDHYDSKSILPLQDATLDSQLNDIYQFKKQGRLLDVGCSVGKFLQKSKKIYSVEGAEINPVTRKIAEKDFKIHSDFLHNMNLPADYDIVTLNQILYGVPDPVGLLNDIGKILKQDGILYINTPNSDSFAVEMFKGKTNHFYGYTSLNIFNKKAIEKLAALSGFKIISFKTEWLDIYTPDVVCYLKNPNEFIHKRNIQVENYENLIKAQDETSKKFPVDLGDCGNYIVCIMGKA